MDFSLFKFFNRQTSNPKTPRGPRRPFSYFGKIQVNEESAMQVAAYNRGVIYISTQIAKLPWYVKDVNNNILDGSISNLLNLAPNPEMNAFTFRSWCIQTAIHWGNSFAEIERNTVGTPLNIWPLKSEQMEVMRATDGSLVYKYTNDDGSFSYLQPRDVYHVKNFHTRDGLIGQGLVAYGREVLGIQISADEMAGGIFRNGGVPSGILSHPGTLSDEAYKRLKDSWADQQGGRKAGSTTILEEGIVYTSVAMDTEALQFLQSRQFGVLEIARFLGIPPTKLFDITAATYSNVENSNLEVATDTLDSWATNLAMEADIKLLNYRYGGRFTDIDLYSIFRGDMKSRSDYFKTMISIGAMTPNQARQREGMPGYGPDGDNYYIPTNNLTPVDRLDEVIDAEIEQKTKPAAAPANNNPPADKKPSALEEAAITFLKK